MNTTCLHPCREGLEARLLGGSESDTSTPAPSIILNTVGRHLEKSSVVVDGPGPGRLLLFRGLRVRMGMHTGAWRHAFLLAGHKSMVWVGICC